MIVRSEKAFFSKPLPLQSGRQLEQFEIAYETYGTLNAAADNAVLLCHSYTSDHHAAGRYTEGDARPGWWDPLIGPGKLLDTNEYFIVSSNCIGGGAGSTGPSSINPATKKRYAMSFPVVTLADMANAQSRLADVLEIEKFHTAIGGCYGGFQVLEWMVNHPTRLASAVVVSATPRASVHTVALSHVMRRAICADANWNEGNYYDGPRPVDGIALFSMFGSLFWQDRDLLQKSLGPDMAEDRNFRFDFEPEFEIERLLTRLATPQHTALDPNALLYLARANDLFDLSRGHESLAAAFGGYEAPTLLMGFDQDWRYPKTEIAEITHALQSLEVPVEHRTLDNPLGHGAFLRDPTCLETHLRKFLGSL